MFAAALLFICLSCMCRGVVAFRRWLHEKAGGDVRWAGGASSSDLGPKLSRQQLRSQWHRHTKDCSACKQVLAYAVPVFA